MPRELQEWLPHSEILTYDEITRLVRIASDLGVTKLRITGGEPLTRRDVVTLFRQLSELPKIRDIGVSTNGSLLAKCTETGDTLARVLVDLKVRTANISLDTLEPEKYREITRTGLLEADSGRYVGSNIRWLRASEAECGIDTRSQRRGHLSAHPICSTGEFTASLY